MDIELDGIRVHAEVTGPPEAPWLVCLHSLATDMTVWDRVADELGRHFRLLMVDLRGHGATQASPPPYTLELLVSDTIGVLDELRIERANVLGLSIGGMVAMGIALAHPSRVDRLIVADARADAPPEYRSIWDAAIEQVGQVGMEPVVEQSLARWLSASFRETHDDVVEALRSSAVRTSVDGYVGCARAVQGVAYLPRLGDISTPTLFIVGEQDGAATPELMGAMAEKVPGAELRVIPGAAHLTPVEAPAAFTDVVLDFLGRSPEVVA